MPSAFARIGSRGSPLALAQARAVRDRMAVAHNVAPDAIEIRVIRTSGDAIQDRPLAEVGGKGLFTGFKAGFELDFESDARFSGTATGAGAGAGAGGAGACA